MTCARCVLPYQAGEFGRIVLAFLQKIVAGEDDHLSHQISHEGVLQAHVCRSHAITLTFEHRLEAGVKDTPKDLRDQPESKVDALVARGLRRAVGSTRGDSGSSHLTIADPSHPRGGIRRPRGAARGSAPRNGMFCCINCGHKVCYCFFI